MLLFKNCNILNAWLDDTLQEVNEILQDLTPFQMLRMILLFCKSAYALSLNRWLSKICKIISSADFSNYIMIESVSTLWHVGVGIP